MRNRRKKYMLSVDQGTTGTRCAIIDYYGRIVSFSYLKHDQLNPYPGWVEHDPEQVWNNIRTVIKNALLPGKIDASALAGIGITNQRETTLVWDKNSGKPVYNAIVWQDVRTASYLEKFRHYSKFLQERTGLPLSTYFSATKLKWILDNVPIAKEKARRGELLFGTVDSWLIWKLTGGGSTGRPVHVTDHTNASRTLLMDIKKLNWSGELLELFRVPSSMMPEIRPSSSPDGFGLTSADSPVGGGIPITGDIGDQQASLFGQYCFNVGDTKCTHGSGSFILQNTGQRVVMPQNGLLTTVAYSSGNNDVQYAVEGSIATSGTIITWLQNNLGIIKGPEEVGKIAASVAGGGSDGVYFVPAFSGLFAPYWDATARGLIIGITQHTHSAHIVRAALESICFQTMDVIHAIQKETSIPVELLRVDGGLSKNDFLMQLHADLMGIRLIRAREPEMTAIGAAYVAGTAVGYWKDKYELITHKTGKESEFKPSTRSDHRKALYYGWQKAVKRAMRWKTSAE